MIWILHVLTRDRTANNRGPPVFKLRQRICSHDYSCIYFTWRHALWACVGVVITFSQRHASTAISMVKRWLV